MKKIISLAFLLLILVSPVSAHAIRFQSGDNITLPADTTINETVFVAANTLVINSPINGDLYCAGRDVLINASISGDVICAAETLKISGKFTGNLRAAARTLDTDADVHSSATLAAQTLTVRPLALFGGDLIAAASTADIGGKVSRDLALGGETINYSGNTLRNSSIASGNLNFSDTAKIGGNLDLYHTPDSQINIPDGSVVGTLNRHEVKTDKPTSPAAPTPASWLSTRLWAILSFLLLGLMLLRFLPTRTLASSYNIIKRPFVSLFSGFGVLVATPIFFLLALITIIGIPAAFVILFVYIIALIISSIISSLALGKLIINQFVNNKKFHTRYYYLFLGLPLLWLVFAIPQVGGLIAFISLCMGLGSYFLSFLPSKEVSKVK